MKKLIIAKQEQKPPRKISKLEELQDGDLIEIINLPSYTDVPLELEDKMEWVNDTQSTSKALGLFITHYDLPDNSIVRAEIKRLMRME